ncbi:uncharacterized protein LOC135366064 [Ornithodoros turicata]|uniref:uncharacterized protein LOC135366064 n=1 Tax=Ornithodoros turicata TaxID=34597 RepID=UPI003138BD5F
MMKWRVQKKKPPLKEEAEEKKQPLSDKPDSSLEEVKASLDYLDSIIEEYNDISMPSPVPVTNDSGYGIEDETSSPMSNDATPVHSPSPIRKISVEEESGENNNISHIIIKDIITCHMSPPPVPRRGPRSCCRNREYPVSPPPRRRYTSPERRMKAALQSKAQESNLKRNPSAPAFNPAYQRHDTNNNVTSKISDVKPGDLLPRVTVTFRTVSNPRNMSPPPAFSPACSPVTFRRKTESRNSIHVDFNVKDLCGKDDNQVRTSEEGRFVRTRSLRGLRRTSVDEVTRGSSVSPPPLPPRKSRDDVKRNGQSGKHVTFCVDNDDATLNGKKENGPASHTDAAPHSPVQRIKLMPLTQETIEDKLRPADENGIYIKTFEPSAVDDVPTDCYNVYNVRTGKISSSVLKPSLVARQSVKSTTNNVSSPLERLRSISPTREAAERFIGKIISKCKSTSPNNKDKKAVTDQHQSRLSKQQRHSRCTKCAVATGKCCSGVPMIKIARGT